MEISVLMETIGTVGFPAAICIYLLWDRSRRDKIRESQISQHLDNVSENMKDMSTTLNKIKHYICE